MGFLKRLRKRFAKLKCLSKKMRKSTSKCCECETLKEEICELNQQLGNMQKRYQGLDLAERQLELLVIELKQSLVPTAKSSNLFKQLSELCESISPPTGCIITPQYFSELDEEPSAPTDFDGESSCQQECDAPTIELSDVNELKQTSSHEEQLNEVDNDFENDSGGLENSAMQEDEVCEEYYYHEQSPECGQLSCSNSAIEFYENLYTYQGPKKIQKEDDLHFSEEEQHLVLDNSEILKGYPIPTSDEFCQIPCEQKQETIQEGKTPENVMKRARLAFESVPELDECTTKLGLAVLENPLILPSTQPSHVEPPWSVPAPKPPSLFPNIERCWLDEEINYDDPIEMYMHQQATSWTAPRRGGLTSAMIQAGRMEKNPPPDFFVEELDQ